jgi:hypothetical protein
MYHLQDFEDPYKVEGAFTLSVSQRSCLHSLLQPDLLCTWSKVGIAAFSRHLHCSLSLNKPLASLYTGAAILFGWSYRLYALQSAKRKLTQKRWDTVFDSAQDFLVWGFEVHQIRQLVLLALRVSRQHTIHAAPGLWCRPQLQSTDVLADDQLVLASTGCRPWPLLLVSHRRPESRLVVFWN